MFTLLIGNKNYSSWSMRPWLALKLADVPFEEEIVPLFAGEYKQNILDFSRAGKVPALRHEFGGQSRVVWDSLAICEYLAECFPHAHLWPENPGARAEARSICAEMHSGFVALRKQMPMNMRAHGAGNIPGSPELDADIARIAEIWTKAIHGYAAPFGRSFLFGAPSIADCYFAPVVSRFITFAPRLDPICQSYVETIRQWPPFMAWEAGAGEESWHIEKVDAVTGN